MGAFKIHQFAYGSIFIEESPLIFRCLNCGQDVERTIAASMTGQWIRLLCVHVDGVCDITIDEHGRTMSPWRWVRAIEGVGYRRFEEWTATIYVCQACCHPYTLDEAILAADSYWYHKKCSPFRLN